MKKPFAESSYLSQVRRLRALAESVLTKYPLRIKAIDFIHHGENATFRIRARDGRKYLLRICRPDYHTDAGLMEELEWLGLLARRGSQVPKPVRSKRGRLIESISEAGGEMRNCCVFAWVEGRFVRKGLNPDRMFAVGRLLGQMQAYTGRRPVKHRRYWTADGLAGRTPKFGSIDNLLGPTAAQQRQITRGRRLVHSRLRAYQLKFPRRLGLIHADLHFGNLVTTANGIGAIDFDDCGYGLHVYDLVVAYVSALSMINNAKLMPALKSALIAGYASVRPWDGHDEAIFEHLLTARRLLMLGWLNSRRDNPRLRKYMKDATKRALKRLREAGT